MNTINSAFIDRLALDKYDLIGKLGRDISLEMNLYNEAATLRLIADKMKTLEKEIQHLQIKQADEILIGELTSLKNLCSAQQDEIDRLKKAVHNVNVAINKFI